MSHYLNCCKYFNGLNYKDFTYVEILGFDELIIWVNFDSY